LARARRSQGLVFPAFLDRVFGWIFRPFNKLFTRSSHAYGFSSSTASCAKTILGFLLYAGLILLAFLGFRRRSLWIRTHSGQSNTSLAFAQLPDGASFGSHRSRHSADVRHCLESIPA